MRDPEAKRKTPLADALAFSVHIFTASGAALALLALLAAIEHNWSLTFLLLGAALFVDGIDGTIARRLDVAERLPRWSGDVLDLVVDYLNYVFIPAFVVVASGLLPPEPLMKMSGSFKRVASSTARVSFSPTTDPMLPAMKAKSVTPNTTGRPRT